VQGGYEVNEMPQIAGANFRQFGGFTSTHVLVWAGIVDQVDRDMVNDAVNNWTGHPDTTIHVLAAHDAADTSTVDGTPVRFVAWPFRKNPNRA